VAVTHCPCDRSPATHLQLPKEASEQGQQGPSGEWPVWGGEEKREPPGLQALAIVSAPCL
jgi:hypothetical protein